ncbi:MAG: hypothetical protein HY512_00865 [Candidatus Aenigmarchaeota archaeon]|nr:hypothetical protein [Candidatus Aenigmarchaeota archaeon]
MTSKNAGRTIVPWVVVALLVGGIIGYYSGQTNQKWSPNYIQETAYMMGNNANSMMQMGQMMMNAGQMMQQKGLVYNDTNMMNFGKEFEYNGTMMQNLGNEMMGRSNGMMGMMK